ncbi:MAG TPA: DegT/DnrJ/EryC1/StrS family aminotransferase [Pirellulales bacterium]|nr:DegT/DnrJ/EryC1/StrS family aminotransferase [Pirellulales bacterium]
MHVASADEHPLPDPQTAGVPLIDMSRQYRPLAQEITDAVGRVLASGRFVLGPDCQALEKAIASYVHVPHAIACASGSDAILLALMALDVGPGDEVIVPSYTFFATASAVARLGAKPVFVDIDPATFNIDAALVEKACTPRTKAIMPVHLFGQCADMDAIQSIATKRNLPVVEDAAQAIGAEFKHKPAGSIGDVGCFSFYPTKNLGGPGDGGMLSTRRQDLADRLRLLHQHGMAPRYYHQVLGINSRLDSLQAAVLNVKLPHLDRWTAQRQLQARRYHELFATAGLAQVLTLPVEAAEGRHVWNQYIVRVPDGKRDALREHLAKHKIGSEIYYPVALHQQQCFAYLGYGPGSLPKTEAATRETLALPIFPELTFSEQQFVVSKVAAFFGVGQPQRVPAPKFLKHAHGVEEKTGNRKPL